MSSDARDGLVCLDVHYDDRTSKGHVAAVCFETWRSARPLREWTGECLDVAPYVPGELYKRELPCLLFALRNVPKPEVVLVDANVWLGEGRPGLGARLWEALGREVPVVGIAKTLFRGADVVPVLRGTSRKPLFVSAAGMTIEDASAGVREMFGGHRIPAMLARVDELARGRHGRAHGPSEPSA